MKKDRVIFWGILVVFGLLVALFTLVYFDEEDKEIEYCYLINNSVGKSNDCYIDEYQNYYCKTNHGYIQVEQYYTGE